MGRYGMGETLPEDGRIAALLPTYTSEGDATRLLLVTGEEVLLGVRRRRVLEVLAARHCQSLVLLRQWGGHRVSGKNALALAMAPELVLLPLRVRIPKVRGDATLGFINVALGDVELHPTEAGTELLLPSGQRLASLWQLTTVRRHLIAARLLAHQKSDEVTRIFFRRFQGVGTRVVPEGRKNAEIAPLSSKKGTS